MSGLIACELNDEYIVVFGLSKGIAPSNTPIWVTDATGQATVFKALDPAQVAGPLTFSYVAGPLMMSNGVVVAGGNYKALLPASSNLPKGDRYTLKIDLASPTAGAGHWERSLSVCARDN